MPKGSNYCYKCGAKVEKAIPRISEITDLVNDLQNSRSEYTSTHVLTIEEIPAAFKRLIKSAGSYCFTPKKEEDMDVHICYRKTLLTVRCSKCGRETNSRFTTANSENFLLNYYEAIANRFTKNGYPASLDWVCTECQGIPHKGKYDFTISDLIFSVRIPGYDKAIESEPSIFNLNAFPYRVTLAFLRGIDTIEELSRIDEEKKSAEDYLNAIREVLGDAVLNAEEQTQKESAATIVPTVEQILNDSEFLRTYNTLSPDQLARFFFCIDKKLEAAQIAHSIFALCNKTVPYSIALEAYLAVTVRMIMFKMSPDRISMTLARYSSHFDKYQQYCIILFAETHMNGARVGFYIKNDADVETIRAKARDVMSEKKEVSVAVTDDYGYSKDNPIILRSIGSEYRFLACLVYDKGEIIKTNRVGSVSGEHILDLFEVTVHENGAERIINLYLDGYGEADTRIAPRGFHLKDW